VGEKEDRTEKSAAFSNRSSLPKQGGRGHLHTSKSQCPIIQLREPGACINRGNEGLQRQTRAGGSLKAGKWEGERKKHVCARRRKDLCYDAQHAIKEAKVSGEGHRHHGSQEAPQWTGGKLTERSATDMKGSCGPEREYCHWAQGTGDPTKNYLCDGPEKRIRATRFSEDSRGKTLHVRREH